MMTRTDFPRSPELNNARLPKAKRCGAVPSPETKFNNVVKKFQNVPVYNIFRVVTDNTSTNWCAEIMIDSASVTPSATLSEYAMPRENKR